MALQTVPVRAPRLSALEWRVALRWFGPSLTMFDVLLGRRRNARGACFAVIDGGRGRG